MRTHNPYASVIEQAHREMSGWRNDSGQRHHNAAGPIFYPQGWEKDMGSQVYHDPGRSAVEVSLPHILNIAISGGATYTVTLFGAYANQNAVNFGNNVNVTVTYTSNNPLVPFTYNELLGTTFGQPMQVGLLRIQAVTQAQATQTISVLRNPGVGKFEGQSLFPLVYPNQYIATITYVENAFKVDGFVSLSYSQNGTTDAAIQIYVYNNANVNVDRAFSNQKVVQEYAKPQTGISQSLTIQGAPAMGASAGRDQHLL